MRHPLHALHCLVLILCLSGCVRLAAPAVPEGRDKHPAPAVAATAGLEALAQWVESGRCRDTDELVGVWRELKSSGKLGSELDEFANSLLSKNEIINDENKASLAARLRTAAGREVAQ